MVNKFKIGNITIGDNCEPVIITELGINHSGKLDKAIYLADEAIKSGAKIIKHQTHVVEDEMIDAAKKTIPGNSKKSIYEIISKNSLSEKEEFKLMQYIKSKKAIFISTPFSREAANRLKRFNIPAFKIGSGECNNYPLIEHISNFKKPIILSTGMNSVKTIYPAIKILRKKKIKFAILHCTNIYPTPSKLSRLNCLLEIKKSFPDAVIGLSDHTNSIAIPLASIAMGAKIIEKHFIDTKSKSGPDISSSVDKKELKELISGSKAIYESLLFKGKKDLIKEEVITKNFAFASVVSIKDIKKNEKFSKKNIWVKRPGTGDFLAKDFYKILGKRSFFDIKKSQFIKKKHLIKN